MKISKLGFGGYPIRELPMEEAVNLIRFAYESGITIFDTARDYQDSENKLGYALEPVRDKVTICSKMGDRLPPDFYGNLQASLDCLRTNYIDIYCFQGIHSIKQYERFMEKIMPDMIKIRDRGIIKKIGITGHDIEVMEKAFQNPDIDVYEFPMNVVYREPIRKLIPLFKESKKMLFAIKALGGPDHHWFIGKIDECKPHVKNFDRLFKPELALNYLKQFPEITSIFAGFTTKEQITVDLKIMEQNIDNIDKTIFELPSEGKT
jgi:aryl-alcohol dehydrogenase-like predicted oxidoreductase